MNAFSNCLALGLPGSWEWIIIALIGLLLFGKRLPEVGKSLGRSIVEFKKGLRGVEEDIDRAVEQGDQAEMLPPPDKAKAEQKADSGTEETVAHSSPAKP